MTKVVHCKKETYDVLIDRTTKWGNPFTIGKDGTRQEVILKHKKWLLNNPDLLNQIGELEGKILGCWCAPQSCHGDYLEYLVSFHWQNFEHAGDKERYKDFHTYVNEKETDSLRTSYMVMGGLLGQANKDIANHKRWMNENFQSISDLENYLSEAQVQSVKESFKSDKWAIEFMKEFEHYLPVKQKLEDFEPVKEI